MRRPVKNRNKPGPDVLFDSTRIEKFINHVMQEGKKETARKVVYGAFEVVKTKTEQDPIAVFEEAMKNAGPTMEVRSRRVGGANYQVPRPVRPERQEFLAMKWIISAANAKKGSAMSERLADEIISASKNEGSAVTQRENTHKMAEANKAFAHFAW